MRTSLTLALFVALSFSADAQPFVKPVPGQRITLNEMQRQFNDWKKTVDLKQEKYWKYYKRYEAELIRHTNGRGEPGSTAEYIDIVTAAAREKHASAARTISWYPVGPNVVPENLTGYMENGIGRINCIAFNPLNPSSYFAGVAQGGVWKTTNNGSSWTPLTDNLPITRISDIAIDPNDTNTIYISLCDFEYIGVGLYQQNSRKRNTHYGLGVYKTTNGGSTWEPTGLSFQLTDGDASLIRKVIVNQANSNKLVACGVNGMYSSMDAGQTWTKNLDSLFWDMVQDPVNPNTLYAASGWVMNTDDGYAAIYKSTDFGATWTMLNTSIPGTGTVQRIKLAIAPSDNNYIYALAVDTDRGLQGFYKSTNAGASWQYIHPGVNLLDYDDGSSVGGQGTYDVALLVDRLNKNIVYTGGINIWRSTDGAQTFNPVSHWTTNYGPTTHADIHFLEQQPLTGNFFVCNDGGLYRTSNIFSQSWSDAQNGIPWPTQWTNIGHGMAITSFYRLSSGRDLSGRLAAGAQDNATFYYDGSSWKTIFGGDGMDCWVDPSDANRVIGSSQYGNFYETYDGGMSWWGLGANSNQENAEWTTPLTADHNNPGTLYAGFENVEQSTDGGLSWWPISSFPMPGMYGAEISALEVAPSNGNVIYAAKRIRYEYGIPAAVYVTTNAGGTWSDITSNLPDSMYFTSIDVNKFNSNIAYISMAGFAAGVKVFMTSNGGSSWQNISYNLPNIPVNSIKAFPGSNDLMAATDIGIYVLPLGSTIWESRSNGLPNVILQDIEFNQAANKIYIATFGRGIWATDLDVFVSTKNAAAQSFDIELYPSVNDGSFTIKLGGQHEDADLEVIDVTGKIVHSTRLHGQQSYDQRLNLNSGMYFARVRGKDVFGVKSFVVR